MKIEIRHRLSNTEEEIYLFSIDNTIEYEGIYFSNRDPHGTFGYDWSEKYKFDKEKEIKALKEQYIEYEYYEYNYEFEEKLQEIKDAYNPVVNKTNNGKPYLHGIYGNSVKKDYPLKIDKQKIVEEVIKKIHTMEIK